MDEHTAALEELKQAPTAKEQLQISAGFLAQNPRNYHFNFYAAEACRKLTKPVEAANYLLTAFNSCRNREDKRTILKHLIHHCLHYQNALLGTVPRAEQRTLKMLLTLEKAVEIYKSTTKTAFDPDFERRMKFEQAGLLLKIGEQTKNADTVRESYLHFQKIFRAQPEYAAASGAARALLILDQLAKNSGHTEEKIIAQFPEDYPIFLLRGFVAKEGETKKEKNKLKDDDRQTILAELMHIYSWMWKEVKTDLPETLAIVTAGLGSGQALAAVLEKLSSGEREKFLFYSQLYNTVNPEEIKAKVGENARYITLLIGNLSLLQAEHEGNDVASKRRTLERVLMLDSQISLRPEIDCSSVRVELANCYLLEGKLEEAIKQYSELEGEAFLAQVPRLMYCFYRQGETGKVRTLAEEKVNELNDSRDRAFCYLLTALTLDKSGQVEQRDAYLARASLDSKILKNKKIKALREG